MNSITRRQFLQAAGGVTLFALAVNSQGLYAATLTDPDANFPTFVVPPYLQPGSASKLIEDQDTLVVAWQTDHVQAQYEVTYGLSKHYENTATIEMGERAIGRGPRKGAAVTQKSEDDELIRKRINYSAALTGLKLATKYYYRVRCNGQTLVEGYATTRKRRGTNVRFCVFGDNCFADISARAIAYYCYKAMPDFVMNAGDNVYENGYEDEYARYFFPAYNADVAAPSTGGPLLRSVPYYTVIANHDVTGKDDDDGPAANFDTSRDSLGYYTLMHLPMNGPANPPQPTAVICSDPDVLAKFKNAAGAKFPRMANYSYDYGDAHFLCLDSNDYVDPTNADLQAWIEQDLNGTDALWKFVVYHHPAFNVGENHYMEQHMRALCPIFEKHGVDVVFSGHEHTYQRTMPLRFAPGDLTNASNAPEHSRITPGKFTVHYSFDGETVTKPDGILHITTGAGGKELYDPGFTDNPSKWIMDASETKPYVSMFYSRHHSLSIVDLDGPVMTLRQVNEFGHQIDQIKITKA